MIPQNTLTALNNFALEQDKSYPPIFVGRKDIIDSIHGMSGLVYNKYKNHDFQPAPTQVVCGAPGAGKTSLLLHLQKPAAWRDLNNIYRTPSPDPLVLYLADPDRLMDVNSFCLKLQNCLVEGMSDSSSSRTTTTESSNGIRSFANRRYVVDSHNEYYDPLEELLRECPINWNRPLIIAIDEFQNMSLAWKKKKTKVQISMSELFALYMMEAITSPSCWY